MFTLTTLSDTTVVWTCLHCHDSGTFNEFGRAYNYAAGHEDDAKDFTGSVDGCVVIDEYERAEAEAEQAAEAAAERFWENRGADDGFDEWEARRGVIDYAAARAMADARLTADER